MAFPVVPVVRPGLLSGQLNGRLPDSILVSTPGQAGGYTVRLVEPAARAWRALCAAALAAGHILKPSGPLDSYRPYAAQEKEFLARFSTTNTGTGITRTWQGKTWWLKPGVALAAVPGTSNHGWGLAVDTGEESDGDTGVESIDAGTLAWLLANELRFGFSHEVQSEPWHIRYTAGDAIPAAVLAFEEDNMALEKEIVPQTGDRNVLVVLSDLFNHLMGGHSGYVPKDVAFTPARLNEIAAAVKDLQSRPPAQVDAAAVAKALMTDPEFRALLVDTSREGANQAEDA